MRTDLFPQTADSELQCIPAVTVAYKALPWKRSVVYLGSCIVDDGSTLAAVKHIICCAVLCLNNRVFSRCVINDKLRGNLISSALFASLLYGLEHCLFGVRDRRCLDGYFLRLVKRVMHLPYDFHLGYVDAEKRLGAQQPSSRLAMEQLRGTGHMLRGDDKVLFEAAAFGPPTGAHRRGRLGRCYMDTNKIDLADCNVIIDNSGIKSEQLQLMPTSGVKS